MGTRNSATEVAAVTSPDHQKRPSWRAERDQGSSQRQAERERQRAERLDRAHQAAVQVLRGQPLDDADQRGPLDPVADPAEQRRDAGEVERGAPRQIRYRQVPSRACRRSASLPVRRSSERAKTKLPITTPTPQAQEHAVATVAGVQGRLRISDLDRPGESGRTPARPPPPAAERAARAASLMYPQAARRRARTESSPASSTCGAQVEQHAPADQKRAGVDEQRGGRPRGGDHHAGERRVRA